MIVRTLFQAVVLFSSLFLSAQLLARDATTEEERAILIRMAGELEYLQELAQKASTSADPNARIVFDYSALSADLAEIQRAIEQHAMKPNRSPRSVKSLSKRY